MTEYYDENGDWVSKTQRKKQCDDMQHLGEELLTLSNEELDSFELPELLHKAIVDARMIHKHGALKRHKQYIGKLMRDIETDELATHLDNIRHLHDHHNAQFNRMEILRDRILEGGDEGINELIAEYPAADRQYLRQLHRNSIREQKNKKPPASARLIFKYIRELSENPAD